MSMKKKITDLHRRTEVAKLGGGADKLDKQRQAGKLTARERVDALVDAGSFDEVGMFAAHRSTQFGMEGKVLLKVEILADGSAGTVEIVEKSPFPQLDELAREKVRTWRFVPARQGNKPIDSSMTIPVEFRLTD